MNIPETSTKTQAISTGVGGFDGILDGGYASHRVHLIEGQPGTGKTTLALQFLLDSVSKGERCLYITLSESRDELRQVAETHGWSIMRRNTVRSAAGCAFSRCAVAASAAAFMIS